MLALLGFWVGASTGTRNWFGLGNVMAAVLGTSSRYELRGSFGNNSLPMLVDARTGDTWLFVATATDKGWRHFPPPKRPGK